MATVTSLTEAKIQDLMAGWQQVGYDQDEINALVLQLRTLVEENTVITEELNNSVLPELRQSLSENENRLSELNDNVIPDFVNNLDQVQLDVDNVRLVDLPSLRQDVDNTTQNLLDRPKVYVQPEAPTNPDEEERYLVVGDVWHDSDNDNKQTVWNGVEWSTFGVEISDFSLTVKKFLSSSHMIY